MTGDNLIGFWLLCYMKWVRHFIPSGKEQEDIIYINSVKSEDSDTKFSIDVWKTSVSKVLYLINRLMVQNMPNQYT